MTCPRCGGAIVRRRLDGRAVDLRNNPAPFREMCGVCGWPDPIPDPRSLIPETEVDWYNAGRQAHAKGQGLAACAYPAASPRRSAWLSGWHHRDARRDLDRPALPLSADT